MSQLQPIEPSQRGLANYTDLANRIADDIRVRDLRPGDPYLTAAEIARQFRVSGTTANKALQLLAQRRILDRRQRSGAFVADPTAGGAGAAIRRVHLLVHQNYLRTEGLMTDGLVIGLQGELPGAQIQFNFLPGADEGDFVRGLIAKVLTSREPEAFVLSRASIDAQRLVHESGLPAVVYGSLHPSIRDLCQLNLDQRQIGTLLAAHLLGRGVRRVAVLFREYFLPGEHQLLDGVLDTLRAAGLGLDGFVLRALPADPAAIQAGVRSLLEQGGGLTGFLCRSEPHAKGVAAAIAELGLTGRRRPPVAVADVYRRDDADFPYPHTRSTIDPEATGREIGRLLAAQTASPRPPAVSRAIPVELVIPSD